MLKSEKRIFSHEHDFFLLFNAIFFKTKLQESFGIFWYTQHKVISMAHEMQNTPITERPIYIEKKLIGAISELRP